MTIPIKYEESIYLPVWYYDYTFGIVSIWEWLTIEEMSMSNFRQGQYEY